MPDPITDDLLDLFPEFLEAQPGVENEWGKFIPSGAVQILPCYIEGRARLVRDLNGREVTSSVQAFVPAYNNLTVTLHRYTLPDRFTPNENLKAITIDKVSDENGPHHEVVNFL